jgi:hypothetical protein
VAISVATAMLAQWCFTAWYMAMGRPNWMRSLAYSAAISGALACDADRVGGEDDARQVDERLASAGQHGGRQLRRG